MSEAERKNVKGVIFCASPINGSDQAEAIKEDLKPFITPLAVSLDHWNVSLPADEYLNHFYDSGFPLSQASKPFNADDFNDSIAARNEAFFKTQIPFRCLVEDKKTYMALVGRSYFTVAPKFGTLVDPARP